MGRKRNDVKFPGWVAADGKTVLTADSTGVEFCKWRWNADKLRCDPLPWRSGAFTEKEATAKYLATLDTEEKQLSQRGEDVEMCSAIDHYVKHVLFDGHHRNAVSHSYRLAHIRHNFERGPDGKPFKLASAACEEKIISVLERIGGPDDEQVRRFRPDPRTGKIRQRVEIKRAGIGVNYERSLVAVINHAQKRMGVKTGYIPDIADKVTHGDTEPRTAYWRLAQRNAILHYLADRPDKEGRISLAHRLVFICVLTGCRKSSAVALRWEPGSGPHVEFRHESREVLFDYTGWYRKGGKGNKRGGRLWQSGIIYDFMVRCFEQRREGDAGRHVFEVLADKQHENPLPERGWRKIAKSAEFKAAIGELEAINLHALKHTFCMLGREHGVSLGALTEATGSSYTMISEVYGDIAHRPSATLGELAPLPSALDGSKAVVVSNVFALPQRG